MKQSQATLTVELSSMSLQHFADPYRAAGQHRVPRSLFRQAFGHQRFSRTQVQVGKSLWVMRTQFALHEGGEQWMVGVPLPQPVQRMQKQPSSLELFKHVAGIVALSQAICQRRIEAFEQAGGLKKIQR